MTAYINYHPRPSAEAGTRALYAAFIGVALILAVLIATSAF